MRAQGICWLLISTAAALFGACGGDDDNDDPGPPASGSGGEGGSPSEPGGAAGASNEDAGAPGTGGAPESGLGGQGGELAGGGSAGAGGQPVEPAEVVIASDQGEPTGIAIDDDYVYWARQDAGTILRCPLTGCGNNSPTELVTDQLGVRGIDVDETSIYWIRSPEADNTTRVRKCPLAGCSGEPEVLLEFPYDNPDDNDVHVDGDIFYYSAWPAFGSCPIDGCLVSGMVSFGAAPAVSIDTDSQYIYVAKAGFGQIHRCVAPDCTDNVILVSDTVPLSVAVDQTTLYFAAYDVFEFNAADPHAILKCPLDGCGTDAPEVVREGISPYAIAVNERRLFFTDVEQGTVTSLAK